MQTETYGPKAYGQYLLYFGGILIVYGLLTGFLPGVARDFAQTLTAPLAGAVASWQIARANRSMQPNRQGRITFAALVTFCLGCFFAALLTLFDGNEGSVPWGYIAVGAPIVFFVTTLINYAALSLGRRG